MKETFKEIQEIFKSERKGVILLKNFLKSEVLLRKLSVLKILEVFSNSGCELSIVDLKNSREYTKYVSGIKNLTPILIEAERKQLGFTFFITRIEDEIKVFKELVNYLKNEFYPRHFNIGLSISNSLGKALMHFDDADVIIIQLTGKREWTTGTKMITDSTIVNALMNKGIRFIDAIELGFSKEVWSVLAAQDALFIPALIPHEAKSIGNSPIVSVSIVANLLNSKVFIDNYLNKDLYELASDYSDNIIIDDSVFMWAAPKERINIIHEFLFEKKKITYK